MFYFLHLTRHKNEWKILLKIALLSWQNLFKLARLTSAHFFSHTFSEENWIYVIPKKLTQDIVFPFLLNKFWSYFQS